MIKVNARVVDDKDPYLAAIKDEANRIVDGFGHDNGVTLNALVYVLGLIIETLPPEARDVVLNGLVDNIKSNMGVRSGLQ
jgi:hypothetical protein